MEKAGSNKMQSMSVKKLVWNMGLPMIISMVLQALYNIVDTAFVINMGEEGINANLALTYAFPYRFSLLQSGSALALESILCFQGI